MPAKNPTPKTPEAPARARSAPLRRRSSSTPGTSSEQLSSQCIARDVAAFKKAGGRIEVLGNTPLRPQTFRVASRGTSTVTDAKPKAKSKKKG